MQTSVRGTAIVLQDKEMEHQVLSSIMMTGVKAYYAVSPILQPEDFDVEAYRLVFGAMGEMANSLQKDAENQPFDALLLRRQLTDNGNLDRVGGLPILSQLTGSSLVEETLIRYAKSLKVLSLRRAVQAIGYGLAEAVDDPLKGLPEIVGEVEQQLIEIELAQSEEKGCSVCDLLEAEEDCLDHFTGDKQKVSWKTGLHELDAITGGVSPGNFVVVGARPGEGKSALALCIATNLSTINDIRTAFITLEMSEIDTLKRMNSFMSEVSHDKVKAKTINALERKRVERAYREMKSLKVDIHAKYSITISKVVGMIRHSVRKRQVQIVVIDYIQLLNPDGNSQQMRYAEVGEMCKRLKQLAMELDICIVGLSQLNRESSKRDGNDSKRPTNTDLRESGELEQSSDMVWLLYRPEYHFIKQLNNQDTKGKALVIVSKNRDGGTGDANVAFMAAYRKFDNLSGPGLVSPPVQMRDYMAAANASSASDDAGAAAAVSTSSGQASSSQFSGSKVIARAKSPQALGCDGPSGVKVPEGMTPEFVVKRKWYWFEEDWE